MKKLTPDLSIIILSYNTKQITKNCLRSIFTSLTNAPFEYEVIVVDNGSTDGSVQMLSEIENWKLEIGNLKAVLNQRNVGFGKGNNRAAKIAQGKYLLFLNSDIVVQDSAIEQLLAYYKQNEKTINFLGGKLLNENKSSQPSCGPFYILPVAFATLFLRGDYWGLTRYSPDKIKEVDWISGACILTTKKIFQAVGGFDEGIFMYMEEIDLLFRAKKLGYRVFFYPQARFIHLGFASSGGKSQPVIQVFRGFLYFYKKHYGRVAIFLLKRMLQLKAGLGILIGRITKNTYLLTTYEEASKIVKLAR